jgi:proline dehydrogenase
MPPALPRPAEPQPPAHYGPCVITHTVDLALRAAEELVGDGFPVALDHRPEHAEDAAAEFAGLLTRVHTAGLAGSCDVSVPVALLGAGAARDLAAAADLLGVAVTLTGPTAELDGDADRLSSAGVGLAIPAAGPGAEVRCRRWAGGRVRLLDGRGAGPAFVRCLNVLMAGTGTPGVATTDPRLVAIAGERAAWYERPPESWEYVMPRRIRTDQRQRLAAAGYRVRVRVSSGRGPAATALAALAQRLTGRGSR